MRSWMRLALGLVLLAGPVLPSPGRAQEGVWEPVSGPYGGSVAAVVISPAYPADHTAFAGLRGQGVYRTVNGGGSWQHAGPDGWRNVVAVAISPDYAGDQTLFATSGLWTSGYSVHRSIDGGLSWQEVTPAWTGLPYLPGLAISPNFALDQTVYVTGGYQTFVSTDGGDTFVQPGGWFATHQVTALAFSPAYATDLTLFALVSGDGLYRSADGGATWDPAGPGVIVSAFAVSPDYAQDAMLLAVGSASGQLYISQDGGAGWSPGTLTLNPNGQHTLLFAPTFSPGDPVIMAASSADPGPYRSEDGGATWTPAGWYDPANPYLGGFVGGSVAALALGPAGSWDSAAFAAASSGIYYSNDRGVHWYRHDDGPARLTVRALAAAPGDPQTLLAGTSFFEHLRFDTGTPGEYDGGLQMSYDGGRTWQDVSGRLEQVHHVAFSPAFQDDGTAFAAAGTLGQHGYSDGGVYRSTDGGQNWEEVVSDRICRALAVSPAYAADRTAWVSESTYSSALGLYVTGDGGDTWTSLAPGVHAGILVPSPNYAVDRTLFAGTQDAGLQRSTDGGTGWTQVLTQPVTALAVSPAFGASRTVVAGVRADPFAAGELYRSTDGGDGWQRLETGIPPTAGGELLTLSALIFAHDGSVLAGVYYGAEEGNGAVYRSVNGGDTWQPVGSGLDGTSVLALATAPVGSIAFYAGGRGGLWQIEVAQGGPAEPGTWEGNGPRGGRALTLAVSPDFASDGLAFTGQWIQHKGGGQSGLGVFRSDDEGQTWQPSAGGTEGHAYSTAVHDYAFSPEFGSDGIVFAATWGGMFRSAVGGQSWSWVGGLYSGPFGSINSVAIAPDFATSGHMMATSGWGGLYLSQDGGIHWTANYSLPVAGPIAYSPAFAADDAAFVAGWYGLYRTADEGASWTHVLTSSLTSLAVSPGFATDGTVLAGGYEVHISHDGGTSWISVTLPVTSVLVTDLAMSPDFSTDQTVFAGTSAGLYESHDGGLTWEAAAGYPGPAVQALAISPGWPAHGVLLAGTDRGVYRTADGGVTWHLARELATLSSGPVALSPDEELLIAGAYRHGVYGSLDGGASWSALGVLPSVYYGITSLAISPAYATDRTLFVAQVSQESIGANIQRSRDGGAVWQQVYSTGYIPSLAMSPYYDADHTLFAGTGGVVVRSQDGGDSWSTLGDWPPGASPTSLVVAAPPGGAVLAAGDGVWLLPPGAATWAPAASGLVTDTRTSSLAISPVYLSDHTLLATASWTDEPSGEARSGVWRSVNGGVNWELASTGLPGSGVHHVVFAPRYGLAYALSQYELYRSLDGGREWTAVGHPPVASTLRDLVVARDGSVYIATRSGYGVAGDGVWRYRTPAYDVVIDGGFEAGSGWEFPQTAWPAGMTNRVAYDGFSSARVGVNNGLNGQPAYSSARQVVDIPADTLTATLRCAVYPVSGETTLRAQDQAFPDEPNAGDSQYLLLLDPDTGAILDTLFRYLSNAQQWQTYAFDLSGYAGRSVRLHFGVYNDAAGGRTGMYVDDVSLVIYRAAPEAHYQYLPVVLKE